MLPSSSSIACDYLAAALDATMLLFNSPMASFVTDLEQ